MLATDHRAQKDVQEHDSWLISQPTPEPSSPRNKGLMFGLTKGNQW